MGQTKPDDVRINYYAFNKPLKVVLQDLSKASNINIVFSETKIPANKPIKINVKDERLGDVLDVLLDDFGLGYQIVGQQVVIVKATSKTISGTIRIYGYVRDKTSGENLIGASIFLHDKSVGAITNDQGFYSIQLPKVIHRIHISYLGYKTEIMDVHVLKDTLMNINLQPDGMLNEVVIYDTQHSIYSEQPYSVVELQIDKIRAHNHLGGEADVMRYINSLPGVSSGAEGIGGLNVRGGSADQNLVLLDGVPVYNTGHILGVFSVFNSNAIKSASFYRGGIPARYAGRLSSVLDIHTRDGNMKYFSGEASVGLFAAKAVLEGPIYKDKASFIVSYRRTHMDIWIKELTKFIYSNDNRQGFTNYIFSDMNGKLNFQLSERTKLIFQVLNSDDDFRQKNETLSFLPLDENNREVQWGNRLYSTKLTSQLAKNFFFKANVYLTSYKFDSFRSKKFQIDSTKFYEASVFDSFITEQGVRIENDWMVSKSYLARFGASYHRRRFQPLAVNLNSSQQLIPFDSINAKTLRQINDSPIIKGDELNIYSEHEIKLGGGSIINLGLNYSTFKNTDNFTFHSLQPRIAFMAGSTDTHFKAGITNMQQYVHLLANYGLSFPSDIWLPTTDKLPPQNCWIFNSGVGHKFSNGIRMDIEAYYKVFDQLSTFKEGATIEINTNEIWEANVPKGAGYAYGVETSIEKSLGKSLFGLNYTYSISDRKYRDINNGNKFPFELNRTHSIKTHLILRLSNYSEFILNWAYLSGNLFSRPENVLISTNNGIVILFDEKNNARYPDFHRLDIGLSFYNKLKWGRAKFFVGVYNAYNRKNPFYSELERVAGTTNRFEFRQYSLLPLLPNISYSISF